MVHLGLAGWRQAFGSAQNASSRWHQARTTLTLNYYRAKISVSVGSKRAATCIRGALLPDLKRLPKSDGRADISLKGSAIVFTIKTNDIASLRASINSYLRLADASYKCIAL